MSERTPGRGRGRNRWHHRRRDGRLGHVGQAEPAGQPSEQLGQSGQPRQANGEPSSVTVPLEVPEENRTENRPGRRPGRRGNQENRNGAPRQPDQPEQPEPRNPDRPRGGSARGRRGRGRGHGGILAGRTSTIAPSRNFGGHLTSGLDGSAPSFVPGQPVSMVEEESGVSAAGPSTAADLSTRIHEDMDNGHYDCCICLNAVTRTSRTWTCRICWRVTHYTCVSKWLRQKRAEVGASGDGSAPVLRCPACNSELPDGGDAREQHCWCGKQRAHGPAPAVLPPHSCGRVCGRKRAGCPHACPAVCHAGPCPPCREMGPAMPCFCGRHMRTRPCTETDYTQAWSCRETCGQWLPCRRHRCTRVCHAGECGDCIVLMASTCYCGREQREVACQARETPLESWKDENPFEGSFHCDSVCGRPFDCGIHVCQKSCHPQDRVAAHCPRSPDVVTHCPCGKTRLTALSAAPRTSCDDAVPSCGKSCGRKLPACDHICATACHEGPCPPCAQTVTRHCRCGKTSAETICGDATGLEPFVCDTPCRILLNCGQHKCRGICCPGRAKAAARTTSKARTPSPLDFEPEHICLVLCGRPLRCGRHACPGLCHRGACLSCTETITDELRCACGRTVLRPPLPCGTTLPACQFDCTRPLPCGHASVAHRCHADGQSCPRCPQLVSKVCLCGKYTLKRVACGTGDLRCEHVCGLPLKCGVHTCSKTCHAPGACEDVDTPCGQPCTRERALCGHACGQPCHGSESECRQDEPCRSRTVVTCPCQRRKLEVRCLVCVENPTPAAHAAAAPACDDECRRLQRNAVLKSALQVSEEHEDGHLPYAAETLSAFRRQSRDWALEIEERLRAFADSDARRLAFRPMPAARRAFLHMLAADYGLDSQSQDPEPHRHVSLFKTPRFVSAPAKTLVQCDALQRRAQEADRLQAIQAAQEAAALRLLNAKRHHPFNALLLLPARADQATFQADVLADVLPALDHSSTNLPIRQTRFEPATLPGGEAVLRAVAPSAAPAAVEQLLQAVLPHLQGMSGGDGDGDDRILLCYVDADNRVVRREGDAQDTASIAGDDSQWNVVARAKRTGPAAAATAQTTPRRPMLTLKKSLAMTAAAERQRRMEILARAEEAEEAGETEDDSGTDKKESQDEQDQDKEQQSEGNDQSQGKDQAQETESEVGEPNDSAELSDGAEAGRQEHDEDHWTKEHPTPGESAGEVPEKDVEAAHGHEVRVVDKCMTKVD